MPAPAQLLEKVEQFRLNYDEYHRPTFNETETRIQFINPLLHYLGWDVDNKEGYAEEYKDVIHEFRVKVEGEKNTKAPDYCIKIGTSYKFFVEAKKPSENISTNHDHAFQLRRYAWSAKLPLSILTDFEEVAVYDCRVKPNRLDKPSTARVMYFNYTEFPEKWDEFAGIFSKQAVLKGSFDRYAVSKKRRGTAEVDDAFLADIETWRDWLAADIAKRNPSLTIDELNDAVQRTIDRIIFLRIAEDRGIEDYGRLQALVKQKDVYGGLVDLYREADARYNSGLFHFFDEQGQAEGPDTLTPGLKIDNRVLKDIVGMLYYPQSPYAFSVLPASILGQVYEQFLGKVITLDSKHRATVDLKPEVRKAGGVYYTPEYIARYIVEKTIGKQVEGKTPADVAGMRFLDPACGSGSFLLVAYDYLLNWHLRYYTENSPKKYATGADAVIYPAPTAEETADPDARRTTWRLTTNEKKRILLNNIYGVDIDRQAVEVTKLSLLLRMLEGENSETLHKQTSQRKQTRLQSERVLPDLANNIKCGNSLIGSDFYDDPANTALDMDTQRRINAFDWKHQFREIMKGGGFDAVIGNPPYGAYISTSETQYIRMYYSEASKFPDSYCCFMVRALALVKPDALVSFIVPNTFCDLENCDSFREWLLQTATLLNLWQTGWAFKSAIVDTVVFVARRVLHTESTVVSVDLGNRAYSIPQRRFVTNHLAKIDYRNSDTDLHLLAKVLNNSESLSTIAEIKAGVKMYEKGKGNPPQTPLTLEERPFSSDKHFPGWRPLYRGSDVTRYCITPPTEFVNYGPWLAAPRSAELFDSPKVLMRRTDDRLLSCIESDSAICVNSCHVIKLRDVVASNMKYEYLLGILNSRLVQRVFDLQNPQMVGKVFAEVKVIYVERLPIRLLNTADSSEKLFHDRIVGGVEQILSLHKQLAAARTQQDRSFLENRIEQTDRQIDRLVYELYGLSEEEIAIVEGVG